MGCVCGKPYAVDDSKESPRERLSNKTTLESRPPRSVSSRREESFPVKERLDNGGEEGRVALMDKQVNGSVRLQGDSFERKRERTEYAERHHLRVGPIPRATEGEQVAAGWPPWLAAVAGEAIKGWVPRRADSFEKLDKVCFLLSSSFTLSHIVIKCDYYVLSLGYLKGKTL